jgi:hypothetical protein
MSSDLAAKAAFTTFLNQLPDAFWTNFEEAIQGVIAVDKKGVDTIERCQVITNITTGLTKMRC